MRVGPRSVRWVKENFSKKFSSSGNFQKIQINNNIILYAIIAHMATLKSVGLAYFALAVCFVGLYLLLISLGDVQPDIRDTVLAVGGGVLGGIAFKYYDVGVLQ